MRQQAKKCTREEAAYLSYWRGRGFTISIDDEIPLNTVTPPSFATRRPVADALIGAAIIIIVCGLALAWVASGAGLI